MAWAKPATVMGPNKAEQTNAEVPMERDSPAETYSGPSRVGERCAAILAKSSMVERYGMELLLG
eukprot:1769032-Alexandrium_andersonii.AAC.1